MPERKDSRPINRWLSGVPLSLAALAAAGWALLLSALCIGSECPETLRVTWWAWLAIVSALTGTVLALRRTTAPAGRGLLVLPIVIAVVVTFAGS